MICGLFGCLHTVGGSDSNAGVSRGLLHTTVCAACRRRRRRHRADIPARILACTQTQGHHAGKHIYIYLVCTSFFARDLVHV